MGLPNTLWKKTTQQINDEIIFIRKHHFDKIGWIKMIQFRDIFKKIVPVWAFFFFSVELKDQFPIISHRYCPPNLPRCPWISCLPKGQLLSLLLLPRPPERMGVKHGSLLYLGSSARNESSLEETDNLSGYSTLFPSLLPYFTWSHIAVQYSSKRFCDLIYFLFFYVAINVRLSSK